MRHFVISLVFILLWAAPARSEDSVPAGDDVIVAVKKGAVVPFDGQLFDITTAIRWGMWLKDFRERAELEADKNKALCETELKYQAEVSDAQLDQVEQLNRDLKTRLTRSETKAGQLQYDKDHPPWYDTRVFWFALGAVTVGGFGLLAAQTF